MGCRWRRCRPRPTAATTGCWPQPWMPRRSSPPRRSVRCLGRPPCTWTPAMTTSPADRCWPTAAWSARSPPVGCQRRSRLVAGGWSSAPCLGQPVRQAALVHRTPPGRGGVLVAAGLGAHRGGSAGPPSLDLLPLGGPSATPSLTACWRRPSPQPGAVGGQQPVRSPRGGLVGRSPAAKLVGWGQAGSKAMTGRDCVDAQTWKLRTAWAERTGSGSAAWRRPPTGRWRW
jgi:hypothetical protein